MTTPFRRAREELPITAGYILLSAMLFAGVSSTAARQNVAWPAALIDWGAVTPLKLWDGDWWRILVSGVHHGNILHLIVNSLSLWQLGGLLEPRLGSLRYAAFTCGALLVSGTAQSLTSDWVGLSGMICGLFGLLIVLRQHDSALAERLPTESVVWGLGFLILCVPLTFFEILPVGNVAHFSGLAYGWLAGQALFVSRSATLAGLFWVAHVWLLPGIYFAMHPLWNARYHWRMADIANEQRDRVAMLDHYQQAVRLDPNLIEVWCNIALLNRERGHLREAWEAVVQGLSYQRADKNAIEMAREIAATFDTPAERRHARDVLAKAFPDQTAAWEEMLLLADASPAGLLPAFLAGGTTDDDSGPLFEARLPSHAIDEGRSEPTRLPAPDPSAPGSAEEGTRL